MESRVYECDGKDQGKLKSLLEKDAYAGVSFARQGYKLKEGRGVGGEAGKYYACFKAEPDFFRWAEEKFKEAAIPSLKRAAKETEAKVIAAIEAEDNAAEQGMGAIFG
ncbi:MAG: hypothetical protein PHF51_03770 [Candidatus ainarchaeum sp.]|nr:hypothetical protein [Candidatus ainarchaeum sp.]